MFSLQQPVVKRIDYVSEVIVEVNGSGKLCPEPQSLRRVYQNWQWEESLCGAHLE